MDGNIKASGGNIYFPTEGLTGYAHLLAPASMLLALASSLTPPYKGLPVNLALGIILQRILL